MVHRRWRDRQTTLQYKVYEFLPLLYSLQAQVSALKIYKLRATKFDKKIMENTVLDLTWISLLFGLTVMGPPSRTASLNPRSALATVHSNLPP